MSAQTRLDLDGGGYVVGVLTEITDDLHVISDVTAQEGVGILLRRNPFGDVEVPNEVITTVSSYE